MRISHTAGNHHWHSHHGSLEEEGDAFSRTTGEVKSVTIESSEMVAHGMKGGSRITYPTDSTWQKQHNCIRKLKALSQKHVTKSKLHDTGERSLLSSIKKSESTIIQHDFPPSDGAGGVPGMISSDEETTVLSPFYETFSAAAGLRSKHSRSHDKKPMPIYQFIADLIQHVSKSISCVRSMNPLSACAAVGGNGKYQYHPHNSYRYYGDRPFDPLGRQADMWDDFDASTFDSIMSGNRNRNNHVVITTECYSEEHSSRGNTFEYSFETSHTESNLEEQ
jgi:hypothetical protein